MWIFLEERGIEMVLSHPSKTRIIAEAKIKTDKIDSKNLAKLLRADFLLQSYIPSKEIILMTIPGIDYYSAIIIKNEIGEIERFPGYKELCTFAGLVPRVHQSGKGRECLVEMDNHTGSASSSKISWRAKKI